VKDASARRRNGATASIGELIDRLFGVTACMAEMRATAWDYDKTVDLMHSMALSFNDTPDLKVTWLENLARYHEHSKRVAESTQATLLAAAHVSEALRRLGRVRHTPSSAAQASYESDDDDDPDDAGGGGGVSAPTSDLARDRRVSLAADRGDAVVGVGRAPQHQCGARARAAERRGAEADVGRRVPRAPVHVVGLRLAAQGGGAHSARGVRVRGGGRHVQNDAAGALRPRRISPSRPSATARSRACATRSSTRSRPARALWPIYYLVSFLGEPFRKDGLCDCRFVYREPGTVRIAELSSSLQEQYSKRLGLDVP
jgi:hypothetical protein